MADELSNIQSLSSAVDSLTQKVNELYDAVSRVKGVAGATITDVKGMINTQGGQIGLGNAARMQMPTQASFSYIPGNQQQGNFLTNSLSNFSSEGTAMSGGRSRGDAAAATVADNLFTAEASGGGGGGGGSLFTKITGVNPVGAGEYFAQGMAKTAAGIAVAAFGAMPDTSLTLQRDIGYYQASLTAGRNANRGNIERASLKALGNGLSGVGSDVIAANILTSRGYTAGSQNYLSAMGEVGGAYKNLGIDNGAAAAAIAGLHSGATSAQMYGLGISTYDAKTGKQRSVAEISRDLMNRMTGGRKDVTVQDINNSLQMGFLGANLQASGLDQATQDMIVASMRNQVQGGSGELNQGNTSYGGEKNKNTVLNDTGRMNASTTDVMQAATGGMVAGFHAATATVVALNKLLETVAPILGSVKGFTSGVMGSNIGQGLVDAAPIFKSAADDFLTAVHDATSGGGTSGYGAAFGVKGGAAPVAAAAGAAITAGYGATDGNMWASTNGKHTGIDYQMPIGTPVSARMSGKVIQVDLNADYGKSILIENSETGLQTLYAHLSEESVKVGDLVTANQIIGKSGDTGNASGPHLHYEVRNGKNNPVDPKTISSGGMLSAALGSGNTMSLLSASTPLPGAAGNISGASTTGGSLPANADSNLVSILTQAGFSGSGLATAYAVAKAESGGRATAYNGDTKTGDQSYGLFQINMLGALGPDRRKRFGLSSNQDLLDPATNAKVAYTMSHGGTNWGPWSTYTNGSYKQFLDKPSTGGGTSGYGGAGLGGSTTGSVVNNFNMPITLQTGNDAELMRVAKKIQTLISNTHDISAMGAS